MAARGTTGRRGIMSWLPFVTLAVGLFFLIRPVALDLVSMWRNSRAVSTMTSTYSDADDPERLEALAQARAYNAQLGGYSDPWLGGTGDEGDVEAPQRGAVLPAVDEVLPYGEQLRYGSEDSVSWIEAPSIGLRQVVYLGTDDATLSAGSGQLEGTSLPVGGESSRCVLTGHSGLTNDRMFDDIRQLSEGDLFCVHTLGDSYTYEVVSVEVVLPEEVEDHIGIVEGEDLVTLVTCTPYHVNTHRLLVTGRRTNRTIEQPTVAQAAATYATNPRVLPLVAGSAATACVLAWALRRRHRGRGAREARETGRLR